jgi:hypothetical protein
MAAKEFFLFDSFRITKEKRIKGGKTIVLFQIKYNEILLYK